MNDYLPSLFKELSELESKIEKLEKLIHNEYFRKNYEPIHLANTILQHVMMVGYRDALRIRISTAQEYQNN
jgi:hypothetical protein